MINAKWQMLKVTGLAAALVLVGLWSGCESDLPPPPRHAGARAVQNPVAVNSAENEIMGGGASGSGAVPLVRIDLPNNKDESPKVTTIIDGIREVTTTQPATRPTTRPAVAR